MFGAVVDAGSFNAAAAELGCTQSRVSHLIGELETILGARLLLRSRMGCVVSEAGHQVLSKARQVLNITESIVQPVNDTRRLVGTVRISCYRSVATHIMPYVLERLNIDYPGINLDINDGCTDCSEVIEEVENNHSDLGVTRGTFGKNILSFPFVSDSYVFVVPAALELEAPVTWEQFACLSFIQTRNAGASWATDQCRSAGFINSVARKMVNESGIIAVIRRGLGFSILPRLAAFNDSDGVKIVDLPIELKRQMMLISNAQNHRSPLVRIVQKFLRDKQILAKSDAFRSRIVQFDY